MAGKPRPLPTKLKILRGNPGKKPLNKREPEPIPCIPQPPEHIQGAALDEWHRITTELAKIDLLSEIDRAGLAAYCAVYGQWVEASLELAKRGILMKSAKYGPRVNPLMLTIDRLLKQLRAYLIEFGMTPAARSRIIAPPKKKSSDEERFFGT